MKDFVESTLIFIGAIVGITWHLLMWVFPFWAMYQILTYLFG